MFISAILLIFSAFVLFFLFFILIYLYLYKYKEAKKLKKDLLNTLNSHAIIGDSKIVEALENLDIINENQKWKIIKIYPDTGVTGDDVYKFERIKGDGELEFLDILDTMLWHIDEEKFKNILLIPGSILSLSIRDQLYHLPDGTEKKGSLGIQYYKPEI